MTDTPLYLLEPDEAATLIAAQRACEAIEARCETAAWDASDQRRAFVLGKVAAAVDAADQACFRALNIAHAYARCQVSGNAMDRHSGRLPRYPDPVVSPGPDAAPEGDAAPAGLRAVDQPC